MRRLLSALALSTVIGSLTPVGGGAAESDFLWQTYFHQGVFGAWVRSGEGNRIDVACAEAALRPNTISFMLEERTPPTDTILLDFGYGPEKIWAPEGRIISDNSAGAGNYRWVMERLKKHSQVRVSYEDGTTAVFSLQGSTAAIQEIGDCGPTHGLL